MLRGNKSEIKVCKRCRKLFEVGHDNRECPACHEQLKELLSHVQAYMGDHEDANIEEVVATCHVTELDIMTFIRDEKIIFSEASNVKVPCVGCGQAISIGKYCQPCKKTMNLVFTEIQASYKKRRRVSEEKFVNKEEAIDLIKKKSPQGLRFSNVR